MCAAMRDPLLKACRSLAGDFLTLTKLWGDDTLVLQFPINLRTEAIKGMKSQTVSETLNLSGQKVRCLMMKRV